MKAFPIFLVIGSCVGVPLDFCRAEDKPKPPAAAAAQASPSPAQPAPPAATKKAGDKKPPAPDPMKEQVVVTKRGIIIVDPNRPETLEKALIMDGMVDSPALIIKGWKTLNYEAERHTAEKIKLRVREADEKARILLEGGAPSHVFR